jgi:hypothetical protein
MVRQRTGPGVVCVETDRADILTAAAQLLSGDSLLVGCCFQLPAPGGIAVSTKPARRAPDRVIAVSAHCLRTRERCYSLLAHCGESTLLILLVATGTKPPDWIDVDVHVQMPPRDPQQPTVAPPPPALYRGSEVPAWAVRLCVVPKASDLTLEPLPQYAGEEDARLCKLADGTEVMLWAGLTVRAGVSRVLQRSLGVSPGLIGVVERFGNFGSPIVRFANMAVVLFDDDGEMPLTPCNRLVTVRDVQELPRLPAGWELERADGVSIVPISHLLI